MLRGERVDEKIIGMERAGVMWYNNGKRVINQNLSSRRCSVRQKENTEIFIDNYRVSPDEIGK